MEMLSISKRMGTLLVVSSALFASCTDKVGENEFNSINNGSTSTEVADAPTAVGQLLAAMPLIHDSREHKYQYQFNLHIDNYAGYLVVANKLQGRLPRTYSPNANFETGPATNTLWVAQQVVPVINSAERLHRPELGAIAAILYDFMAHEYVDVYGAMPYKAYRTLQSEPPIEYEKANEVYAQILEDLKKQQGILKGLEDNLTQEQTNDLKKFDKIAGGNLKNWIKFANSLRMRLAMRMVKVDPVKAQTEFESAYQDGALEHNDDNIELKLEGGQNPLNIIANNWDDSRLSANFANLLTRLHHPILSRWFTTIPNGFTDKNGAVVVTSDNVYAGIRTGVATFAKEEAIFAESYKKFSSISPVFSQHPIPIFKASEVQFLLAEAALRGWSVGGRTAEYYYGAGINAFFRVEGLTGDYSSYTGQQATACPRLEYVDYWNSENNSPASANGSESLGVKWSNSLSKEKKLEMIITQKYISNYPLSLESWSDFRRTGYPVMLPNSPEDSGDGSLPPHNWKAPAGTTQPETTIRRIPFVKSGSVSLNDINTSAIPALRAGDRSMFGGEDLQASHIWWDVPSQSNF